MGSFIHYYYCHKNQFNNTDDNQDDSGWYRVSQHEERAKREAAAIYLGHEGVRGLPGELSIETDVLGFGL